MAKTRQPWEIRSTQKVFNRINFAIPVAEITVAFLQKIWFLRIRPSLCWGNHHFRKKLCDFGVEKWGAKQNGEATGIFAK